MRPKKHKIEWSCSGYGWTIIQGKDGLGSLVIVISIAHLLALRAALLESRSRAGNGATDTRQGVVPKPKEIANQPRSIPLRPIPMPRPHLNRQLCREEINHCVNCRAESGPVTVGSPRQ